MEIAKWSAATLAGLIVILEDVPMDVGIVQQSAVKDLTRWWIRIRSTSSCVLRVLAARAVAGTTAILEDVLTDVSIV